MCDMPYTGDALSVTYVVAELESSLLLLEHS